MYKILLDYSSRFILYQSKKVNTTTYRIFAKIQTLSIFFKLKLSIYFINKFHLVIE